MKKGNVTILALMLLLAMPPSTLYAQSEGTWFKISLPLRLQKPASVANISRPLPRRDRHGTLFEKLTLFLSETLFTGAWNPWENRTCCWVVICKNKKAHREANIMFGHKILLGETDSFEPVPVSGPFLVQCDECGEEQSYVPDEVLRLEVELPESFTPHPRFR